MKLDQATRMQMLQEVRLMKLVQHPNVVRLYEVSAGFLFHFDIVISENNNGLQAPRTKITTWKQAINFKMVVLQVIDTQTKLYLVLELGDGGDMYDYIMKHEGGLGEDKARKYFR